MKKYQQAVLPQVKSKGSAHLYTDRHAVFIHRSEYQPTRTPTQFGRAMEELGTQLNYALSPQAKEPVSEVFIRTNIVISSGVFCVR